MTRYINPYTDFGFKKLFGEEGSKDILIDFLNQLLPERHQIAELTFINTEHLADNIEERKAFFDIRCISTTGEHFIIEMQKCKFNYFKDRTLYYLTFPIKDQAQKGEWNFRLEPVYFIGILDFLFDDPINQKFKTFVTLKDQDNKQFYDKLGLIYLQMPAFNKTADQLESKMDKWAYFLKNLENFDTIPQILNEPVFKHAFQVAEFVKLPKDQQAIYEKSLWDYIGFKEINKTSREEGRKEGIEQGREEEKREIAKGMKEERLPISTIIKLTGLTEFEINEL